MNLLNHNPLRASPDAGGDASVAVILLVMMALVFGPVALAHAVAQAGTGPGAAAGDSVARTAPHRPSHG
jgi:hypothetical protein